ncbi:gamma-tubulin complex component 6 isoform X4 [Marmota marmota marmota]|uniref:gamma-tubulin complex component 6 isoform X4 n=1 Tax=Marmota marmota marmota TaxID=9994 RepID=UPI002092AFE5|nr:gamma-tubulin complex component 6 isoform X4 [Marmota marmota marmota]
MAGITQLFDDLCEALLPAAPARPGQRGVPRSRAKQTLKRVAYNALFTSLFQEETQQPQPDLPKLPVRNKVLMLSFDLRVGGLGPEADRLEELVEGLEADPCCPLVELGSALDLLVQLAGSGPPRTLRRKRDYFCHNRHAGRNVPYGGYDCCDLRLLEMDVQSLIASEEYSCHSMVQETLQVMEAAPGTGLPTVGLFSFGDPCGDRFERETRISIFGALVHSRTYDMDVRLDLPPVPDSADLSGLAIKVPQSVDQWEDEGFQSASNLTPDSQSEPSMTPDVDLWEAALTYEPSKRRCWERVGCPPGHKEEPYLTEAGRDAFDRFCRLRQGELQALSGGLLQAPRPMLVKEQELVKDSLNVLLGVVSATFSLCQLSQAFVVERGVHVSGASPESISSILSEVAEYGTCYTRLSHFSLQPVLGASCSRGLVFQAFTSGLRRYLQYYRACVLATPPTLSLLTIGFLFKKLGRQLRYLAELCGVGTVLPGSSGGEPGDAFPTGVKLLSYLYQEALDNCSNEHYPVLLSLLKTSCEPYTRFIHDWVYSGVFRDVYGEFMIQVNHEYLGFRDKFYWTHGYVLISKEVEDCVPVFLKHIAHDVYVCGKTINLLKLCCPRHYLCWSDVPVPRISVIFSLEELKEIEKDCAVYVGRMERVARHSSISKEEKELRMEIAKQELIVHAREAASRVLSELSDRQMSEQMALDARKREQFQRLKEQFVKDQERRLAARQEELEDDFSYAREVRDREKRLTALEEELDRKARQALVDHYSKLSAEAARREQRALWRIQRHRLESARLRFFLEDEKRVQEMLKNVAEACQPQELLGHLPGTCSQVNALLQVTSPGPEHPDRGPTCNSAPTELHLAAWDCPGRPSVPTTQAIESPAVGAGGSGTRLAEGAEPFSAGLSITDFLPLGPSAEQPVQTNRALPLEEALQTISSDLPAVSPGEAHATASTQPAQPQEYDFSTVLRPAAATSPSSGPLQAVEGSLGPEEHAPWEGTHEGTQMALSPPLRHVTSEEGSNRPTGQLHRHVSDASIRVGENMPDVAPSRPRWNVHGHVSDASIRVGENRPEAEPNPPWPHQSPPSHVSQAGSSLEVQNPALEHGPQLPADMEPSICCPNVGSLQTLPSAASKSSTLGDSVSEEPGAGKNGDNDDLSPSWPPNSQVGRTQPGEGSMQGAPHALFQHKPQGAWEQLLGGVPTLSLDSQEGTAAPSSPEAAAEVEALRWGKEQAYVAGLASRYRLEQYPDSYESMSEAPAAHLVRHVLPRAFAFPVDPRVQSAVDETTVQLTELLTLPVLMQRSLTAPLAAHVSLVNKAAVDYFFAELHLEAHFEALRHFLLMEDGEFAQSLSDLLFEKYLPEVFAPNAPDVLSCLELRYKVDWPLNIVITENCLSKYSGIFSFLLQLKLMMWTLKDICFHLKRTALVSHAAGSVQFRQLQLFKHEMQHFVKVTQGYIANQILHVSWCEFRARLATVGNLEEIQRAHAEYLHKAVFRGLLTEKAAPVMNIIHSIFSLVLKFRSQLISQAWGPASGPRGAEHPNFALMQQSYSTFKYYSHFLFKVVTKLVNRGYQPHLEDFLLRINFNSYYQDS